MFDSVTFFLFASMDSIYITVNKQKTKTTLTPGPLVGQSHTERIIIGRSMATAYTAHNHLFSLAASNKRWNIPFCAGKQNKSVSTTNMLSLYYYLLAAGAAVSDK